MKNKIIIVDDDENALASYQAVTRNKFDTHCFTNGNDALEDIKKGDLPAVFLSDYNMPGMNGIELLRKVKKISPLTTRALITGFADLKTAMEAVNEVSVFRFITKPVQTELLIQNIESCIKQFKIVYERNEIADMKEKFAYMVTHEFKNPLASIMISTEMIEMYGEKLSPEDTKRELKNIKDTVFYISQLQDEILNLGIIDNTIFEKNAFELISVTKSIIDNFQRVYDNLCNIKLESSENEIHIKSNEFFVKLIINNLISNAIKYSETGSEIAVELKKNGLKREILVKDKGIGIPGEDLENLFKVFFRAGNSQDRKGAGLGLSIVKKCVDKLNGKIFINSALEAGSVFHVIL